MKYLCLIYDEEKAYAGMSEAETKAFMGEYFAFTDGIKKSGHYIGGEPRKIASTRLQRVKHSCLSDSERRSMAFPETAR